MRNITEHLFESVNESIDLYESVSVDTKSNADRRKQLQKELKGKDYPDFVSKLNQMLDDPKAKALLIDGFGGDLADTHFQFKKIKAPCTGLLPTQNEIDVMKSIDYALKYPENLDNYYQNANCCAVANIPILTFNAQYIIDGHHRWSQMFAYNPEIQCEAFNYTNRSLSPIAMLKATQGAIAATKADENGNDGHLPQAHVDGQNLYSKKWGEEEIKAHIKEVVATNNTEDQIMEKMKKYRKDINTFDDFVQFVTDNLLQLKGNNYPVSGAPGRGDMPQTDKGGTAADGTKNNMPDDEGSALNRLKDGVDKGSVK